MGKCNVEATFLDKLTRQWVPMVGTKWGRLTVVKYLGRKKHGADTTIGRYECVCECGNTVERNHSCLTQKQTVSCGCWKRERIALRTRKPDTAFRDLWFSYRKGAKERGLEWSLTEDQFRALTKERCHYTGREPSQSARSTTTNKRNKKGLEPLPGGVYLYNGVDRVNSSIGYTAENCVPCCSEVNQMKMAIPYDEFIALCKEIAARH